MMLFLLAFLLLAYASLAFAYAFAPFLVARPAAVPSWPELPPDPPPPPSGTGRPCATEADCPEHHACLGGTCVRKLLRGGRCDPAAGEWRASRVGGSAQALAVCVCKDPDVYGQRLFGGDCDVSVACGRRGTYDPATGACACEPGYLPFGRLECRKAPAVETLRPPCDPNEEVEVDDAEGYHRDYVEGRLRPHVGCVRKPCSFDAFTGRPLRHARFEKFWGCVCDPSRGLFGVVFQNRAPYLQTSGFDACASVFVRDDLRPKRVEHVTYFYLGHREPVSVVTFDVTGTKPRHLAPVLRGSRTFAVHQTPWRYDFAQYFFRTQPNVRTRVRWARRIRVFNVLEFDEGFDENFRPKDCGYCVPHTRLLEETYDKVYAQPVCKIRAGDRKSEAFLHDRVVVNPQFLTHDVVPERHNAFVMRYASEGVGRWEVDVGHPYRVDFYRNHPNNAPAF